MRKLEERQVFLFNWRRIYKKTVARSKMEKLGETGTWIVNHVKNFEFNYQGSLEMLGDLKQKDMAT